MKKRRERNGMAVDTIKGVIAVWFGSHRRGKGGGQRYFLLLILVRRI